MLTEAQREQYARDGYVKGLRIFEGEAVEQLQREFQALAARIPPECDINQVNMWHKASVWAHGMGRTDTIADCVESVLGPSFYQWGGQFFVKRPGDGSEVPWHQDCQYWPLSPVERTTSIWLAVYDVDADNGAMEVIRGSHTGGNVSHATNSSPHLVLDQEADVSHFRDEDKVSMDLKAGEAVLFDSALLHCSKPNLSASRMRAGMTMRYAASDVKCDLAVWPTFECYPVRGDDASPINPVGKAPSAEGHPVRKFQHSSDFA